jgi:serine/threonine protein kinase
MIGTAIGPYQVLAKLGEGGMGEVYRARDPRLARDVALKILRDRAEGQASRIDRFVTEARAASALNHPNIVAVYDAVVDGATPYLVTELIEGESLAGEIRRGPMPLKRVIDLATQIADGLAEAHAAAIVHGDLKPANIMITRGGRVKIVDFGLAHSVRPPAMEGLPEYSGAETETAPGLRGGTVPYMSPELARGEASDFRADQFALGLVLYGW